MTDKELEQKIKRANDFYRIGEPVMSDEEYDKLIDLLKKVNKNSELLKKGVIKTDVSRKQKLPIPMYSLNKVKSIEELKKWILSKCFPYTEKLVITPKLDGISLVVNEEVGRCFTRGDGEYGQRSDTHFALMQGKIMMENVTTFGEAIMPKENFLKYKDKFANPRNMVAGLFNHKSPNESLKDVHYIRYGSTAGGNKISQLQFLNKIDGNCRIDYVDCCIHDITEEFLNELYDIWGEEYQIDGLVIEFNDSKIREELGREENMNPAYAVAYKNPAWSSFAKVKTENLTFNVSKQGKIKPVVNIPTVEIGGVMVSNANGINMSYVIDWHLTTGTEIVVARSGDVIPKIIEVEGIKIPFKEEFSKNSDYLAAYDKAQKKVELLFGSDHLIGLMDEVSTCPCCGEPTKWDETMTELLCTNPDCKDMKIAKLVHFFTTIGVEEFGEPSIKKFYELGFDSVSKILNMPFKEIALTEGWGEKSANKLLSQFKQLKEVGVPLARLLHSLSLGDGKIGEKTYQLILDSLSPDYIFKEIFTITALSQSDKTLIKIYLDLIIIPGIAEITAKEFINNLIEFRFVYDDMLWVKQSYIQTPKQEPVSNLMSGLKICFTGFRDKELEEFIVKNGGEIVSGVTKNTTILVTKTLDTTSSKASKAIQLGVKTYTVESFKHRINDLNSTQPPIDEDVHSYE